jgi:hypothetical protein
MLSVIVAQREPPDCLDERLVVESVSSAHRVSEVVPTLQQGLALRSRARLTVVVSSAAQAQVLLEDLDRIQADRIQAVAAPEAASLDH